ncbi:MAG: tocopherol cyclase family protein [Bacteroidales bacterium]|jgi:tocopherol cyclase|nr:tocopherol cyclase family protein [Bacteroidales bacterium]
MLIKTTPVLSILLALFVYFGFNAVQAQKLEKEINFSQHKIMPCYNLKKVGNTTIFQGNKKDKKYFEGWYFKMVSADGSDIISVIPGISLSHDGSEQHAFVQVINGVTAQTSYYSFPIDEFSFSKKQFQIKIGENFFSEEMIILDLKDSTSFVSGKVEMSDNVEYKFGRLLNPGIMGWYRFVPFMECYHGVVSLTNRLSGALIIDDKLHNFSRGKGYIEKDWGSSMPSSWIWMQSNHFNDTTSSFMLSIADIPWLGKSFTGFLGFFYHDKQLYHFSTYRNTKLHLEGLDSDGLTIKIENKKNSFLIHIKSKNAGLLKAPTDGSMDRRIAESIDAELKISMWDKKGNLVFTDSTNVAGLEMVGDYMKLQDLLK